MKKETLIILIIILIIGGILYWVSYEKPKFIQEEKKEKEKEFLPVFGLNAKIAEIDVQNNYLVVKSIEEEIEMKVNLSEDTKIIKLKFPPNSKYPFSEEPINLEEEEIKIEDLKIGENIIIRTSADIAGKSEFNDVISIKVLP